VIGAIRRYVPLPRRPIPPFAHRSPSRWRLEQTPSGGKPLAFADVLAAGLEFNEAKPKIRGTGPSATNRLDGLGASFPTFATERCSGRSAGARRGPDFADAGRSPFLGSVVSLAPLLTLLGRARRTLMPWTSAEWPSRNPRCSTLQTSTPQWPCLPRFRCAPVLTPNQSWSGPDPRAAEVSFNNIDGTPAPATPEKRRS